MRSLLLLLAAGLALASPAAAQTRLSVAAGGVVPFGDLGDVADPSLAAGLRLELQPVNALGQRRLLAFTFAGTYSSLDPTSEREAILDQIGGSKDSSLLQVDAGIRVYSAVAPFFVSGAGGYSRFDPTGNGSALQGGHVSAGLGFLTPVPFGTVEVEGRLSQVFLEDNQDFQLLTVLLGVGLPF
jgi:hypothetical protein